MKLQHPWVLGLLLVLPVFLVCWGWSGRSSVRRLRQLVAERLVPALVGPTASKRLRMGLVLAGMGLGIVALARPQWGEVKEERPGWGRDVIIAVDVSRSMLASDMPPSRLKRAKLAAEDLVRLLPGDRIGLVAFAGSAFLQAPVTSDHAAVLAAIHELEPDLIPLPGTHLGEALRTAVEAFEHSEGGQKALILMTDGEDLEADALEVAKEVAGKIRIFTVGIGTPEGAVLALPSPRGGVEYVRDESGNVVQSRLDEGRLQELATLGGGFYTRLLTGPLEMQKIVKEGVMLMEQHEIQQEARVRPLERYQWPLAGALGLLGWALLLGERPRSVRVLVLCLVVLFPAGGFAKTARELYEEGDYAGSLKAFEAERAGHPDSAERAYNWGAAAYKSGDWAKAIEGFGAALAAKDPAIRSRAEYNLANTLVQQARQGRRGMDDKALEQAIAHYDEALRRNPELEDAVHNREVARKLLEQKPPQKPQSGKDESKDSKDKKESSEEKKSDSKGDQNQDSKPESSEDGKEEKEGSQGEGKGSGKPSDGSKQPGDSKGREKSGSNGQAPERKEESARESKPRGELKSEPVEGEGRQGSKKEGAPQGEPVQAGDGKMTKEQAAALMEALRSEDRRVQLWVPNGRQQQTGRSREGRTW